MAPPRVGAAFRPPVVKKRLRRWARLRRHGLGPSRRRWLSRAVRFRLLALPEYRRAGTVALYAAIGSEVETHGLLRAALGDGKTVALPVIQPVDRPFLRFARHSATRRLAPGPWGVPQPPPGHRRYLRPSDLDLIVVPGVAFDRQGRRLGYGAGYYDSFLARLPRRVPRVGLAYSSQVVPRLPEADHDERVDILVTDNGVYRF